jgi:DNA-binding transcriptional ArsR family regulator
VADALDLRFQALGHPVRRYILARLAHGPATVAEAGRGAAASKAGMTKHVHVLERAGLVRRTVQGRTHVLTLQRTALDDAAAWIDAQRALWEHKFDIVAHYLAAEED